MAEAKIGVELELLNSLVTEIKGQLESIARLFKTFEKELKLDIGVDDSFFQGVRQYLGELREMITKINTLLNDKTNIKLGINDDEVQKLKKQMTEIFEEALTKTHDEAKKVGKLIADEIIDAAQELRRAATAAAGSLQGGKSRSGGTGASGGSKSGDVLVPQIGEEGTGKSVKDAAKDFQSASELLENQLAELERDIRFRLAGIATAFERGGTDASQALLGAAGSLDRARDTFTQKTLKRFLKEIDPLINQYQDRIQQLARIRATNFTIGKEATGETGANFLDDESIQKTIAGGRAIVQAYNFIGDALDQITAKQKIRNQVVDSGRQVAQLAAQSERALQTARASGDPSDLKIVVETFRSLGQVLAKNERDLINFQARVQELQQAVAKLRQQTQIDLDIAEGAGDEAQASSLRALLQGFRLITEELDEQERLNTEQIENLNVQRQRQRALSTEMKNEINLLDERNRLAQASRRAQVRYTEELQNQKLAAQELVNLSRQQGGRLGTSEVGQARKVLNDLQKLETELPATVARLSRALAAERNRLQEEFAKGTGRFQRASGEDASPAQQQQFINAAIALKREERLIEEFVENSKQNFKELGSTRVDLGDIVENAEAFAKIEERTGKLNTRIGTLAAQAEQLGPSINNMVPTEALTIVKAYDNAINAAVRDLAKYRAELSEARIAGKLNGEQFKDQATKLNFLRSALRDAKAAGAEIFDRQRLKAEADAFEFLEEGVDQAREAINRLAIRYAQNTQLLKQGGNAAILAAEGFKNVRRELRQQAEALTRQILNLERTRAATGKLSDQQQAAERDARALLKTVQALNTQLTKSDSQIKRAADGAKEAGRSWTLYNASLVDSIRNNFRFINALTVITSAMFLLRTALFEIIEESRAFSRTLTVLQSQTLSTAQAFEKFKEEARAAAVEFGVEITEVAEVVKQFGSAGLEVEESLAGLDSALRLIISTNADAETAARQIAGIYNVFGDQLSETGDQSVAFARITDTLTSVYRNNQAELDELVQGLQFAAATGKLAGFTFEEISGFLAVLNDNLIKSGKAGRGLQVIFSQFAAKQEQFTQAFGIVTDPNASIADQFIDSLEEVNRQLGQGEISVSRLEDVFRIFGLRGARSFATLAQNVDDVKENIDRLNDSQGTAALLANLVKDELANSFERAKNALLELIREGVEPLQESFIIISDLIIQLKEGLEATGILSSGFIAFVGVASLAVLTLQTFLAVTRLVIASVGILRDGIASVIPVQTQQTAATKFQVSQIRNLVGANIEAGASSQILVKDLDTATKGVGRFTNAVALGFAAIPLIAFAIGQLRDTVDDAERALEKLEGRLLDISQERTAIKAFEKEFDKAFELVKSGAKDAETAGNQLRRVITQSGAAFVDLGDVSSRTNQQIVEDIDIINGSIREQIELQKILNDEKRKGLEVEKRDALTDELEARTSSLANLPFLGDDRALDESLDNQRETLDKYLNLLNSGKTEEAAENLRLILAADGETTAPSSFSQEERKRFQGLLLSGDFFGLQNAYESLSEENQRQIDKFQEEGGESLNEAVRSVVRNGLRVSSQTLTREATAFNRILEGLGFRGGITSDAGQQRLLEALGGTPEDARLVGRLADAYQEIADKAAAAVEEPDFDLGQRLFDETIGLLKEFDTAIDDVTFDKLLNKSERAEKQFDDLSKSIRQATNAAVNAEIPGLSGATFEATQTNFEKAFNDQVGRLTGDQLLQVVQAYDEAFGGLSGLDRVFFENNLDSDEIAKRLEDDFDRRQIAFEVGLDATASVDQITNALQEKGRKAALAFLSDQTVINSADELFFTEDSTSGRARFDADRTTSILRETNKLLEQTGDVVQDFANSIIRLEKFSFFTLTGQDIADTFVEGVEQLEKNKKVRDALGRLQVAAATSRQQADVTRAELDNLTGGIPVEQAIAERFAASRDIVVGSTGQTPADPERAAEVREKTELLLKQDETYQKIVKTKLQLAAQDAKTFQDVSKVSVEVLKRLQAQEALNLAYRQQQVALSGSVNEAKDLVETAELQVKQQEALARRQGEFSDGVNNLTLNIRNDLFEAYTELLGQIREIRLEIEQENIDRLESVALAEQLLDRDNERAGIYFRLQSATLRLNRANRNLNTIQSNLVQGKIDELDADSQRLSQYRDILDAAEELFDIEDQLNEEIDKNTDALANRLEILKQIRGVFGDNQGQVESQLSDALNAFADRDVLSFAAAAAGQLDISLGAAAKSASDLIPLLIEGARNGRVTFEQFDGAVAGIGARFASLQGEINTVQVEIDALLKEQIARGTEAFARFLEKDKFDEAQTALNRVRTAAAELFDAGSPELLNELRKILDLQEDLDLERAIAEDKLRIELELINDGPILDFFKTLRDRIRELTDEQISVGVVTDDQLKTIVSGGTVGQIRQNNEALVKLGTVFERTVEAMGRLFPGFDADSILRFRTGGYLPGYGGGDKIPALLESGEFVMPKEAVSKYGRPFFEGLRSGGLPGFQDGGSPESAGKSFGRISDSRFEQMSDSDRLRKQVLDLWTVVRQRSETFNQLVQSAPPIEDINFHLGTPRGLAGYYEGLGNTIALREPAFGVLTDRLDLTGRESEKDRANAFRHIGPSVHELVHAADVYRNAQIMSKIDPLSGSFTFGELDRRYDLYRINKGLTESDFVQEYVADEFRAQLKAYTVFFEAIAWNAREELKAIYREIEYYRDRNKNHPNSNERRYAGVMLGEKEQAYAEVFKFAYPDSIDAFARPLTEDWAKQHQSGYEADAREYYQKQAKVLFGLKRNTELAAGAGEGIFNDIGAAIGLERQVTVQQERALKELQTNNAFKRARGILNLRTGGQLAGYGGGDKIPALLEAGEFVMPKEAVAKYGTGFFEGLRRDSLPGFEHGGAVHSAMAAVTGATSDADTAAFLETQKPLDKLGDIAEALDDMEKEFGKLGSIDLTLEKIQKDGLDVDPEALQTSKAQELIELSGTLSNEPENFTITKGDFAGLLENEGEAAFTRIFGSKDILKDFEKNFKAAVGPVAGILKNAFDLTFLFEGAAAFGEAIENYRAGLEELTTSFKSSLGAATDTLLSNQGDFLSYIDQVQQAEKEYYNQRAEAAKELRAELAEAEKAFKNALGANLGTGLKAIGTGLKAIGPGAESIQSSFAQFSGGIAALRGGKLSGEDQNTTQAATIRALFETGVKLSAGALSSLGGIILDGVSSLVSLAFNPEKIDQLLDGFDKFVSNLIDNAPEMITKLLESFDELLGKFVEALPDVLNTIIEQLPRLINGLAQSLAENLPIIIEQLAAALPELIRALIPALANLAIVIIEQIPAIVEALAQALPTLIIEVVKAAPRIILALVKAIFGAVVGLFKGLIKGFVDEIKRIFGGLNDDQKERRKEARKQTKFLERQRILAKGTVSASSLTDEERKQFKALFPKRAKALGLRAGGMVPGSGRGDIVPAMLEPGEYVIPRESVRALGPDFFETIRNYNELPRFQEGGLVGSNAIKGTRAIGGNVSNVDNRTNVNLNATVAVSGTSNKAEKRQAAREMVEALDEELANLKRNRKSKFDKVR